MKNEITKLIDLAKRIAVYADEKELKRYAKIDNCLSIVKIRSLQPTIYMGVFPNNLVVYLAVEKIEFPYTLDEKDLQQIHDKVDKVFNKLNK